MSAQCPGCGEQCDEDDRFCGYCGHALDQQPVVTASKKPIDNGKADTSGSQTKIQTPFMAASLIVAGVVVFVMSRVLPSTDPTTSTSSDSVVSEQASIETEESAWNRIKGSTDPQDFRNYLEQFPNGPLSNLAKILLKRHEKQARADRDASSDINAPSPPIGTSSEPGWMGVAIEPVSGDATGTGVRVKNVVTDGPGAQAGLRVGDVILQVSSQVVDSPKSIADIVSGLPPKKLVLVLLSRDENRFFLTVRLGKRPKPESSTQNGSSGASSLDSKPPLTNPFPDLPKDHPLREFFEKNPPK